MLISRLTSNLLQSPLLAPHSPPRPAAAEPPPFSCPPLWPLCPAFDSYAESLMDRYKVPGMAVAVVTGDQTHTSTYGHASFHPPTSIHPTTLFYTGSTTKAFTAAALALLIANSTAHPRLSWKTPLQALLPGDFALADAHASAHVTLQDAASHRSGLPRHDASVHGTTPREVVRSLRWLPLTRELRERFMYCNLMYATLGYVVEVVSGMWLGDVLKERIWGPLGMRGTFLRPKDAEKSGLDIARGHVWVDAEEAFREVAYEDLRAVEGAGAVISNVEDYAKWIRMMIRGEAPLGKEVVRELTRPRIIVGEDEIDAMGLQMYGYGWQVERFKGYEVLYHSGAVDGFGTNVLFIPALDWGCVFMTNSIYGSLPVTDSLTWHLVEDAVQVFPFERTNRTARWDEIERLRRVIRNQTYVREIAFPKAITGNLSASLPLKKYVGVYTNPGYGDFAVSLKNGTLWNHPDRGLGREWNARMDHVSGDNFFVVGYTEDSPEDPFYTIAEFQVDFRGVAVELGVLLEAEMLTEKIWFRRKT